MISSPVNRIVQTERKTKQSKNNAFTSFDKAKNPEKHALTIIFRVLNWRMNAKQQRDINMNNQQATTNKIEIREKSARTLSAFRSDRQLQIKANVVNSKLNKILSAVNAAQRAGVEIAIHFVGSVLICKIVNSEKKVNIHSYTSIPQLNALLSIIQSYIPLKFAFLNL